MPLDALGSWMIGYGPTIGTLQMATDAELSGDTIQSVDREPQETRGSSVTSTEPSGKALEGLEFTSTEIRDNGRDLRTADSEQRREEKAMGGNNLSDNFGDGTRRTSSDLLYASRTAEKTDNGSINGKHSGFMGGANTESTRNARNIFNKPVESGNSNTRNKEENFRNAKPYSESRHRSHATSGDAAQSEEWYDR
jgi:hypothetical protein